MTTEKKAAITAWRTATNLEKLTPLLRAIGKAITGSRAAKGTFKYAHELGRFSNQIATATAHISIACLDYNLWTGRWYVMNHDLEVYSAFEMWFDRYYPDSQRCETGRIASALKRKRMQQAYDRYQKSGLCRDHLKLLSSLLYEIDTSRGDWVSLFVQGKRPLGNSGRVQTIWHALGWGEPWLKKDRSPTEAEAERAWNLFDELAFAAPDAANVALKHVK